MKKGLLFVVTALLFSLHSVVYAQQDAKKKFVVEADSSALDISLMDSNCLVVRNAPLGKKLEIYSVVGNKVKEFKIKDSHREEFLLNNLPRSVYIVKLDAIVRKYVIK